MQESVADKQKSVELDWQLKSLAVCESMEPQPPAVAASALFLSRALAWDLKECKGRCGRGKKTPVPWDSG